MWTLAEIKKHLRQYETITGGKQLTTRRFLNELHFALAGGGGPGQKFRQAFRRALGIPKPSKPVDDDRPIISKPTMNPQQQKIMLNQIGNRYSSSQIQQAGHH